MRNKIIIGIILIVAFILLKGGVKSCSNDKTEPEKQSTKKEAYSDGTYAAEVEYYNPNTGTRNTYTLNVEVKNNKLTLIQWPQGGWLDDSHFYPEELDNNGKCSFKSDAGYRYTVTITGSETSYPDKVKVSKSYEDNYEEESDQVDPMKCPNCDNWKYSDKDLCGRCESAITCQMCGGKKEEKDRMCYDCTEKAKICPLCHESTRDGYSSGACDNCKQRNGY
jgi:hypothetical protein